MCASDMRVCIVCLAWYAHTCMHYACLYVCVQCGAQLTTLLLGDNRITNINKLCKALAHHPTLTGTPSLLSYLILPGTSSLFVLYSTEHRSFWTTFLAT